MRHVKRTADSCQVIIDSTHAVTVNRYHVENATAHERTDKQSQIFNCYLAADNDGGCILDAMHGCDVL